MATITPDLITTSLRMPPDLKARIEERSKRDDRTASATIRVALERYLASDSDI